MEKNETNRKGRGRPVKTDTASHCVMVRFNGTEHTRFLTMYEPSGLLSDPHTQIILACNYVISLL